MDSSMQGKIVLVTGGTNGIGLVTAREIARLGGEVTIAGRNAAKCAKVAAAISPEGGPPVDAITADLSTLAGIRQAAEDFKARHTRLHVLVNNAGGYYLRRALTPDGYEYTFALNHLSYFLLTHLLLDLLKASVPARVVNVSSGAHRAAKKMDFSNLQTQRGYTAMRAYSHSKLANLLFTYELAHRLEGTGITVNALHPGYVATGFARNNGPIYNVGNLIASRLFGISPERGAQTSIYLASSPEVASVSGKYFSHRLPIASSPASYDEAAGAQLWEVSMKMAGLA
jgi:NAD(P)-dependent dehydrogenase (short-subunit alcohol dehydrogenase family)